MRDIKTVIIRQNFSDKDECFFPRMMFLFQTLPILTNDLPFKQWQKDLSKFLWQGEKTQVKMKIFQDAKEREELGLPDLKQYFGGLLFSVDEGMGDPENQKIMI